MSQQKSKAETLEQTLDYWFDGELKIDRLNAATSIRAAIRKCLPEKSPTAAPRGKMMSFNETCINSGFNAAIDIVEKNFKERGLLP